MHNPTARFASALLFVSFAVFATPSRASNELISDLELMSVPSWCKSAFQNSDYNSKMAPRKSLAGSGSGQSQASIAGLQIPGGHHFCAGLIELNRAKRGRGTYTNAITEINYSYSKMGASHPQLSFVASYLGKALYLSGKKKEAGDVWIDAIHAQPDRRESYLALAEALMKEGQNQKALEILLEYDNKKELESADAEQFLAQAYFNLKQYDNALVHAENAKRMGYPFPGLLDKLKRIENKK